MDRILVPFWSLCNSSWGQRLHWKTRESSRKGKDVHCTDLASNQNIGFKVAVHCKWGCDLLLLLFFSSKETVCLGNSYREFKHATEKHDNGKATLLVLSALSAWDTTQCESASHILSLGLRLMANKMMWQHELYSRHASSRDDVKKERRSCKWCGLHGWM